MKLWIEATRPKTLIASISPVLIGTVIAKDLRAWDLTIFLATIIFALCIQIGTNFANDYIDFLKGADTNKRKGPRRLVQSGLVSVKKMRLVTLSIFLVAGIIGLYLMKIGGWQIGALAFAAILFGYLYTGGPFPLGYLGLGDLFVLIFFGPVAVAGTTYLQTGTLSSLAIIAGCAPGLFSTAMLALNNIRDIEEDRIANKKTLPVRFGSNFGKWEAILCLILPCFIPLYLFYLAPVHVGILITIVSLVLIIPLIQNIWNTSNTSISHLFLKVGKAFILYTLLFVGGWLF